MPVKTFELCGDSITRTEYEDCLEKAGNESERALEAHLQASLERLRKNFTNKDVSNFQTTQKKWLAYRKSECNAEEDLYGKGTDAVAVGLKCLVDMTNKRNNELHLVYDRK